MALTDPPPKPSSRPFPDSLCYRCAAPPRFVTSDRGSVFIHCPLLKRYPPQPVRECAAFVPVAGGPQSLR